MKGPSIVLFLASLVSLWVPSVTAAETLYQIDINNRIASPSPFLDVSAYAATTGGLWRLIDGQTYVNQFGFATPIVGLPDGVSLDSISSSTSSTIYAHGDDGVLYQIDTNNRIASPSPFLDVSAYAATTGGLWRLIDGQTYVNQFGFATPIVGLPDGVSLDSISSSTSSTIYAHGDDGVLYQIDTNNRIASPSSYLDISAYASTTGGLWRLIDGQTYVNQFGFATPIVGLPDGVSVDSISSSNGTTIYAYAAPVPEPSAYAAGIASLLGGIILLRRRRTP